MKRSVTFLISALAFFFLAEKSHAQEFSNLPSKEDLYKGNNAHSYNDISGMNVINEQSPQEKSIINEIKVLKRSLNPADKDRLIMLEEQLAGLRQNPHIPAVMKEGAVFTPSKEKITVMGDVISNGRIYNNPAATVKGIVTVTEQRGTTAGKIWLLYFFSSNPAFPDSLRLFSSQDNGASWTSLGDGNLAPWDRLVPDDVDMEIIENASGQKYLWIVYTSREASGAGRTNTSAMILRVPSLNGTFFTIRWPGSDTVANRHYDIKITSDNATYAGTAYTYIVTSFDSLAPNGNRINTQKYARCVNPYTLTPAFSYMPQKFYWFSGSGPAGYQRTLHSDIAYFQNGANGDSVIVSFSGVPDSAKIFFAKADIFGNVPTVSGTSEFAGSEAGDFKQGARLSTNGNNNGSVLCVFRQLTGGNWNVKHFRSNNFGNFNNGTAESILWGSSANPNGRPDVVGRRNSDIHYFTFGTYTPSVDSIHYVSVTSSGSTSHIFKMNSADSVSQHLDPKTAFSYASGDSCLAFYAGNGAQSVWRAKGCSGAPVGISNNSVPVKYELAQNYPNPFNPATSIRYSIPVKGLVKLTIYSVLGKEVAVLVNDVKEAGSYIIDFNAAELSSGAYFYKLSAGDFTTVRKMLLVK